MARMGQDRKGGVPSEGCCCCDDVNATTVMLINDVDWCVYASGQTIEYDCQVEL